MQEHIYPWGYSSISFTPTEFEGLLLVYYIIVKRLATPVFQNSALEATSSYSWSSFCGTWILTEVISTYSSLKASFE